MNDMSRALFVYEKKLFECVRAANIHLGVELSWYDKFDLDELQKHDADEEIVINRGFCSWTSNNNRFPDKILIQSMLIYPQVLFPSMHFCFDANDGSLVSYEIEANATFCISDYEWPISILSSKLGNRFEMNFSWFRIILAFDKLFFLCFQEQYFSNFCGESLTDFDYGDVEVLSSGDKFVGLDGWVECPEFGMEPSPLSTMSIGTKQLSGKRRFRQL